MKFYSGYSRLSIVQALIRISVRGDFLAFQKCQGEHLIINNEYLKLSLSNLTTLHCFIMWSLTLYESSFL